MECWDRESVVVVVMGTGALWDLHMMHVLCGVRKSVAGGWYGDLRLTLRGAGRGIYY